LEKIMTKFTTGKITARKIALGLSLAATAVAGTAYAEQAMRSDGVQTRAEAQSRSAAIFAKMDINKDGKLDKGDREARRNLAFDRLDTDKNGQISRTEFSARPQHPEAMAKGPEGMKGHGGKRGHGWNHRGGPRMGMMADTNQDGTITQAEFSANAMARFDKLDANKDGTVTKEERQTARKAMRDEWQAKRAAAAKPAN
jgi:Ca2+-binding EF-hand superfamily protein